VGDKNARRSDLIWTGDKHQETVRTISIDSFLSRHGAPRIDFIRVDCEGAEMLVLQGAATTIERDLPAILIEIHPVQLETLFESSGQAVLDQLHGWGYRTFSKMPTDKRWHECIEPVPSRKPWKD